ncbi:MAG: class I SAM-dependent methyltransferase [Chloroflexota bacterium]
MTQSEHVASIITQLANSHCDQEEIKRVYKEWSSTYDQDLDDFGYVAPQIGAEIFHQANGNVSGLILDAGCGTGLTGKELSQRGYTQLHGCDFSPDMRAVAKQTGVYSQLMEADFTKPLAVADAVYDGVLCIGVYYSEMKRYFLPELIRIVKPMSVICISCRFHFFDEDLHLQAKQFEEDGVLTIESVTRQPYMKGQGADAAYIVLRKC